ncbi:extracellular solute-binding protein [Cohnella fermenti]|uniref:Extracellular solute-binding protein n=1 Tax=Cohnella fermenti TaxID=2565925 RepID=A0A4S4BQH1_9BACL|nr:extracellular solute-binding protein [Cohnella fermenti]THF76672.1 extracellular solute-binding protein [Cohnella fermenti]
MKSGKCNLLAVTAAAALALSACSNANNEEASPSVAASQPPASSAQAPGAGAPQPDDPLAKYETPIEVTTVRAVNQSFKYKDGDSIDSNIWTQIFEEQYGIKVKNLWVVDESQYRQKLNISIASGDIPDFMLVNKEEMLRMNEAGQLEDLTDLLKQYATPYLNELLQQDNGVALSAATIDGKLIGVPQMMVNGGVSTSSMLYVRSDWMKKLNLSAPKTIDDVIKIAEAFAKDDPDGNGKPDTYGLGVNKDLYVGHGSLTGFFNGYQAYPRTWIEGADGELAYGSVQPEMRAALEKLRDLYASGGIDQEFAVKDWSKLSEEVAAGKLGLAYGYVSDGGFIQKASVDNNPNADWAMYPIVSLTGQPVSPQLNDTASNFYVVKKGSKHPEAMIKLADIYLKHYYETNYAPDPNPFISGADGVYPGKYQPVTIDPLNVNLDAFRLVQDALAKGDGSQLGFPASVHYDRLSKFAEGDKTMWFSNAVFGAKGSYSVIDYYDKNKLGVYSKFQGAATTTMAEKGASLDKLEAETFTKIIMGESPIGDFDKYVEDWKKLGGDDITKEVNAWYASRK